MTATINMNIQQWTYERGNYQIIIENAWAFLDKSTRYTQERITVNGERVRDIIPVVQSILFWRTVFEDTVLDGGDDANLKVQWKSGIATCKSRLLIDGRKTDWTKQFARQWDGPKGHWPDQSYYEE